MPCSTVEKKDSPYIDINWWVGIANEKWNGKRVAFVENWETQNWKVPMAKRKEGGRPFSKCHYVFSLWFVHCRYR
jgi:hypothetical protein